MPALAGGDPAGDRVRSAQRFGQLAVHGQALQQLDGAFGRDTGAPHIDAGERLHRPGTLDQPQLARAAWHARGEHVPCIHYPDHRGVCANGPSSKPITCDSSTGRWRPIHAAGLPIGPDNARSVETALPAGSHTASLVCYFTHPPTRIASISGSATAADSSFRLSDRVNTPR